MERQEIKPGDKLYLTWPDKPPSGLEAGSHLFDFIGGGYRNSLWGVEHPSGRMFTGGELGIKKDDKGWYVGDD